MAVTVVSSSHSNTSGAQSSLTYAHTSTGDPLYVLVAFSDAASGGESYNDCLITFDGVEVPIEKLFNGFQRSLFLGILWSPGVVVAGDIVIKPVGGTRKISSSAHNINGGEIDGNGCQNFAGTQPGGGSNTTVSLAIASATGDLVMDFVAASTSSATLYTVGADQTSLYEQEAADTNEKTASSTEPGAASVTMSWTLAPSLVAMVAFNIPAAGTVAATPARVTQAAADVMLSAPTDSARVTSAGVDVMTLDDSLTLARLTHVSVDVLIFPINSRRSGTFIGDGPGRVWSD